MNDDAQAVLMDIVPPHVRSRMMASIRGHNTQPELQLRRELHRRGYRYRLRARFASLRCTPDLVFPSRRLVVFVDGCFWHRCPRCFTSPKSRVAFWNAKIDGNVVRDKRQTAALRRAGWTVVRVWEHDLPGSGLAKVLRALGDG